MQLFRIKAGPAEAGSLADYLENHYVSCGAPGIGDMSLLGKAEIMGKLTEGLCLDGLDLEPRPAPKPVPVAELVRRAEELFIFAQTMQDGDYVIVDDGERMVLGDLGDYYYLPEFDNAEDRSGHRRGVTWIQHLHSEDLHPELLAFLAEAGEVGVFGRAVAKEQLERMVAKPASPGSSELIGEATIREALDILKAAMRSEDPERRERAAAAILQAAGRI
ncbi:hypothetical protein GZH47_15425 [Paenibacillus rhizovicinus]|uniref:Uncharacterized protein n=1 Tax=Paenibacillus rhizovicinus TaxID=2704463 RepID=A0A6C0P622_9BACL|nr:hypothetical protein [Paenibacillus rhizovicinus]QHW32062.1 hypothetical protein GZH47_15425 [Paenibacillus rhizovicinus]